MRLACRMPGFASALEVEFAKPQCFDCYDAFELEQLRRFDDFDGGCRRILVSLKLVQPRHFECRVFTRV